MSVVQLDFFAPNDINGAAIATMTDEDDFFEGLELKPRLRGLGGGMLVTSRQLGFAAISSGVVAPETFVRVLIPEVSTTKYLWGFFLDLRKQQIVSRDEKGGERFTLGGPGPLFYFHRAILWDEQFSGAGWRIDRDNGVFRFEEDDTVGNVLQRLYAEDAANTITQFLPDATKSFDNTQDSAGNAWGADYTFGTEFELPIGGNYLEHLWNVQEGVNEPLEYTVDLGSVGSPRFRLDAWKSYGRDLTGSVLGPGVVLIREGVNIEGELEVGQSSNKTKAQGSGTSTRKASHVLVRGKDGSYGRAVRTSWDPGEYAKAVMIDYPRTAHVPTLNRAGLRWLRRQENGDNEFELTIAPGFDESTGRYMAGPDGTDGHVWLGDTITLKTGDDPTSSWLDFQFEPQWVTGIDLVLDQAARDDTAEEAALSWHLTLLLNIERNSDNQRADAGAGEGGGRHTHGPNPKLCVPGTINVPSALATVHGAQAGGRADLDCSASPPEAGEALYVAVSGSWVADGDADAVTVTYLPGYNSDADPGTPEPLSLVHQSSDSDTLRVMWFRVLDVPAATGSIPLVRVELTGQCQGAMVSAIRVSEHTATPSTGIGSGTGTATADTLSGDGLILKAAVVATGATATAADFASTDFTSDWTADTSTVFQEKTHGAGYGAAAAAGWSWTGSYDWRLASLALIDAGSVNDGHADLVGLSTRAARCDHRHDVHRDRAPTVNDDWATDGYKLGTIWAQLDSLSAPTAIVGTWMLVDITEGAAVWLAMGGGLSEAEVQTLIDTAVAVHEAESDPHAVYLTEAEHAALTHETTAGSLSTRYEPHVDYTGSVVVDGKGDPVMVEVAN